MKLVIFLLSLFVLASYAQYGTTTYAPTKAYAAPTKPYTTAAPTEAPTEYYTTAAPTKHYTTAAPTEAPTEYYTTAAPTEYYTTAAPTKHYTTAAPTEAPTEYYTTAAPTKHYTTAAPTKYYTTAAPTKHYTTAAPTKAYYTTAAPTKHYTTAAPTKHYTTAAPTKEYTSAPTKYYDGECEYHDVKFLETSHVPQIIDYDLTNNKIKIVISAPLVKDRTTEILLGNSHDDNCMWPDDGTWTFEIVDCMERYTLKATWDQISGCNWKAKETEDEFRWCTDIVVMPMDVVGHLRDYKLTRWTEHLYGVCLTLPKNVEINDDITIFAPIKVIAGIDTQHIYSSMYEVTADIGLTTSVQWPFYLKSESFQIPNIGTATLKEVTEDGLCADVYGQDCTQMWMIDFIPYDYTCELDGKYTYVFSVHCHHSVDVEDCPLMGETATITAHLDSAAWCPDIELEGDLLGKLDSYKDAELSIPRDAFFVDRTVYFKAVFMATLELATSEIVNIRLIRGNGNEYTLLSDGSNTADGNALSLVVDNSGSHYSVFHIYTDEDWFDLDMDAIEDIRIECDATVTYVGGKRGIESGESVRMNSAFGLQGSGVEGADDSAASVSAPALLLITISAIALLF